MIDTGPLKTSPSAVSLHPSIGKLRMTWRVKVSVPNLPAMNFAAFGRQWSGSP